jgi:serine protease Do
VKLTYRRKEVEATVDVRLAARGEMFTDQMNRNDQMSGDFSPRRSGFPRVLQHDILGNRAVQGGPLLDLDGRCIGMNIARANRAESFAIPMEDLKEIAGRLMK